MTFSRLWYDFYCYFWTNNCIPSMWSFQNVVAWPFCWGIIMSWSHVHISHYKSFTCNFIHENSLSYVNCFNSICEMKISDVKLIFNMWNKCLIHKDFKCKILKQFISRMNWVFHMWIGSRFVCEMKISYVKMFQFHMFFTCEITCETFVRKDNWFPHCPSTGKPGPRFTVLTTRRKE